MEEKIKIYIRSKNKIYIFFNDEIYFFENQELEMALESFFEENNIEKNAKLAVILHYSYFLFDNFDRNMEETGKRENNIEDSEKKSLKFEDISEVFKKKINFVKRKMVINHLENQFLDIYLDKREIVRIKNCLKKYSAVISELKVDFEAVYNYYKDGNFEANQNKNFENKENFQNVIGDVEEVQEIEILENRKINRNFGEIKEIDVNEESLENDNYLENENGKIEILQLGEENSLRILIEDEKIVEVEKIELKIEDVDDVENFDFGDMVVVGDGENDVKVIFAGEELSNSLDFIERMAIFDKESVKNIKVFVISSHQYIPQSLFDIL